MISIEQIKGARGLLEWTQDDLAQASKLSKPAINNLERRIARPRINTIFKIQKALEGAGVEFIDGGVRFRTETLNVKVWEGDEAMVRLINDMLETFGDNKGEVLIAGIDERRFTQSGGQTVMRALEKFWQAGHNDRLLARDGDTYFISPHEGYRWVPEDVFMQVPYMVYANKYALILYGPPAKIVLVENAQIAQTYRGQFEYQWKRAKIPPVK